MDPRSYKTLAPPPSQLGPQHRPMPPYEPVPPSPVSMCAFPSPAPRMVYCQPAAYQQINGQRYQKMAYAYGRSRPMAAY